MPRSPKRNGFAKMRNLIAERAGTALDHFYAGQHRDKRIARDFGVSVRMAQYLRAGEHWTTERLAQASVLIGMAFDRALYTPSSSAQDLSEINEIDGRLARLEAWRAEMDRGGDAGLAPIQNVRAPGEGGGNRLQEVSGIRLEGEPPDRGGAPPSRKTPPVAPAG